MSYQFSIPLKLDHFPDFIVTHPRFLAFRDSLWGAMILRALAYRPRFEGRGRRTDLVIIGLICSFIAVVYGAMFDEGGLITTLLPLSAAASISWGASFTKGIILLPLIAAMVRRFHDTSRTAWAFFVIGFPGIGAFIFLGILFWDGDKGDNSFGPDPRRFDKSD